MKTAVVMAAVLGFCGCHAVYTREPVGQQPKNISGETAEWAGTWCHAEGAITVTVRDGSNGVLGVAWIEDDNGTFTSKSASVQLREFRDWTFATIRVEEAKKKAGDEDNALWGRIERKKRATLVWFPDAPKFKRLVHDGKLPGVTNGGDVVLGTLTTNHLALIASEAEGVLFEWDEPLVLWKTSE